MQREPDIRGPRPATRDEIPALNRVFAEAFTDRYRRDGMVGVRVPRLNAEIWRYALEGAGPGAMLWVDNEDEIVAFNIAHVSGAEGWMGPLAVRTDRQGQGLGQLIVTAALEWLQRHRVRTIGLETMPRTVDNIGFYSQMGFLPGHITVTMVGEGITHPRPDPILRASQLPEQERESCFARCRMRLVECSIGSDYSREMRLTHQLGVGDTIVIEDGGTVRGFAVWHSAPLVEGRPAEELRLLKVFADSLDVFDRLLNGLECCAAGLGLDRVAVRCQTEFTGAYVVLVRRGYRVRWTDLRMTLEDFPSPGVPAGKVLFSNWEI